MPDGKCCTIHQQYPRRVHETNVPTVFHPRTLITQLITSPSLFNLVWSTVPPEHITATTPASLSIKGGMMASSDGSSRPGKGR